MKPRALLLHGGPGLSDYLDPLAEELSPLFKLDRYAQNPHTDVPAFVEEALGHLHAPSWIVGHSWGGHLALHVAAAAPAGLQGLILIGTLGAVGDGGWEASGPRLRTRLTDDEVARLDAATSGGEGLEILWPAYFARRELAPPYPGLSADGETLQAIYDWVRAHGPSGELAAALRGFDEPVLAIHGTDDHIPLEAVQETIALLPDGELRILEGTGHFPWLEQPGVVHDAVVDFRASRSS
jgi:proline iminopeptidase